MANTLRAQSHIAFGEEERMSLYDALDDVVYARGLARALAPAETRRFNDCRWDLGDPSYMGGEPFSHFATQLATITHTLFGRRLRGARIAASLDHACPGAGEEDLTADLAPADDPDAPIVAETIHVPPTQDRHATGSHVPAAQPGLAGLHAAGFTTLPTPVQQIEEVLAAEFRSSPEAVAELERLLRAGAAEGQAPRLYRYRTGGASEARLDTGEATVLMLVGAEVFDMRMLVHDVVFGRLLAARDHLRQHAIRH